MRKLYLFISALFVLLILGLSNAMKTESSYLPNDGFFGWEGTLHRHDFQDYADTLSGQYIYELKDENGYPLWFCRDIFKDVCITGECKMIDIWLFWDGVGNYLGIQLPEDEYLTRYDNTRFGPTDYVKLDIILHDRTSILRDLKQEELTIESGRKEYDAPDAISSATNPNLEDKMIDGAIYTCHTLWHTVYGPTRDKIIQIIDERINHEYIKLSLNHHNPHYVLWAMQMLSGNMAYHNSFYKKIASLTQSVDMMIAQAAIQYFQRDQLSGKEEQIELVSKVMDVDPQLRSQIIWRFADLNEIQAEVIITMIDLVKKEYLSAGSLNQVFRMITPNHLANQALLSKLEELRCNQNSFIRFQTERYLKEL